MKHFLADNQLQHAIASLTVTDTNGKIIYHYNDQYGVAPASNMKVFTSIAVLDLLGKDYQYKTEIGCSGKIKDSVLQGNLFILGHGDPSFGSWRYTQTQPDTIMKQLCVLLRKKGINSIKGEVIIDASAFTQNPIPGGWSWEDMGNYYGAGTWALNWHENQYDMELKPGKNVGEKTEIVKAEPALPNVTFVNKLTTAAAGSGDNSLIFLPPYGDVATIEGTIPQGGLFTISGSLPEPFTPFISALKKGFADNTIQCSCGFQTSLDFALQKKDVPKYDSVIGNFYSPTMDSLIYFFLKRSINLYGEDFVKTLALQKNGEGNTDDGVEILKKFWRDKGLEGSALRIVDGSGLSAGARVTTDALVKALLYAKSQPWYPVFYNALPVVNDMHMKTGTIGGVRAFSGYQTASDGRQYVFSFIVNNYNGSSKEISNKMYEVLNELKK